MTLTDSQLADILDCVRDRRLMANAYPEVYREGDVLRYGALETILEYEQARRAQIAAFDPQPLPRLSLREKLAAHLSYPGRRAW